MVLEKMSAAARSAASLSRSGAVPIGLRLWLLGTYVPLRTLADCGASDVDGAMRGMVRAQRTFTGWMAAEQA